MNLYFHALALASVLAIAPALAPIRPAFGQPLPDRAPLVGVVSNVRGEPIADAVLSVRRSNASAVAAFWGATTQSDDAGRFSFPDAEEGDYAITAEAPGYAQLPYLEVKWRVGAAPLRITLDRLINFSLRLRAPDGAPVQNAPVFVRLRPADFNAQKFINARTDEAGALPVPEVKPDNYSLYLRAPGGFALLSEFAVTEPQTPTREVQLQNGGAMKVTVTDSLGQPLGGASLSLAPATVEESRRLLGSNDGIGEDFALLAATGNRNVLVSRDGDGTIALDALPPGVYTPRLSLPGYNFPDLEPVTIAADKPVELKVETPSHRARTLNLQLRSPGGEPYTAGEVSLRILPIAANGQLGGDPPPNPDDADDLPFFPSGPGGRRVLPDAQGRVSLYPVKAGRYRIFAAPQPKEPGQNSPEATPVDVTITQTTATATVIVPNS